MAGEGVGSRGASEAEGRHSEHADTKGGVGGHGEEDCHEGAVDRT